jgi:hypothetical protein
MRAQWLARLLLPMAVRYSRRRPPDFEVVRDGDREVYLRRWWLVRRNSICNVYLHNMLRSDDVILHDHMYVSASLMLGDGLSEVYKLRPPSSATMKRDIAQGEIVFRSSNLAHQLVVREPTWTVFVTGPRIKPWGFWCPRGWKLWSDYVAVSQNPDGSGRGLSGRGVGCGEME